MCVNKNIKKKENVLLKDAKDEGEKKYAGHSESFPFKSFLVFCFYFCVLFLFLFVKVP